ncbi:MAG TPA: hypothetical protein DET40_14500 [Lentisphaeria bacterium]|nr:MAG: hypothetical protein A2X45_05675 [Lentisphaerae bacterium GWF2_50_93]HCE44749.1 hypothetical protein [Lentisphaeria bacterium]
MRCKDLTGFTADIQVLFLPFVGWILGVHISFRPGKKGKDCLLPLRMVHPKGRTYFKTKKDRKALTPSGPGISAKN